MSPVYEIKRNLLYFWLAGSLVVGSILGGTIVYAKKPSPPPTREEKVTACIRECAAWSCRSNTAPACEACVKTCGDLK